MKKTKDKGITLIALVITIIVLLILAGITIRAITGEDSLIKTTNYAKEETNKKTAEENVKLKIMEIQVDKNGEETFQDIYIGFAEDDKFDIVQVSKKISSNSSGVEWTDDIDEIYVISKKYSKYIFEINRKLEIKLVTLGQQTAQLEKIEITTKPNKVDYYIGETFLRDGMVVTAYYTDGTTKKVEDYTITQLGILDGTTDEIEVMYQEDGITKMAVQKISIGGKPYAITVSGITTTGFNIGLSLTETETNQISSIKYYVNDSISGTNFQTVGTVTGLSDYTKKYVWAEVTYNSGVVKKSTNYKIVYTAHSHGDSCYSNFATYYVYKYNSSVEASYKSTVDRLLCISCSWVASIRNVGFVDSYYNGDYDNDIEYTYTPCHTNESTCYALDSFGRDDDLSSSEKTVYPKHCSKCGGNLCDSTASSDIISGKCAHIAKTLSCSKNLSGSTYDYNF